MAQDVVRPVLLHYPAERSKAAGVTMIVAPEMTQLTARLKLSLPLLEPPRLISFGVRCHTRGDGAKRRSPTRRLRSYSSDVDVADHVEQMTLAQKLGGTPHVSLLLRKV